MRVNRAIGVWQILGIPISPTGQGSHSSSQSRRAEKPQDWLPCLPWALRFLSHDVLSLWSGLT